MEKTILPDGSILELEQRHLDLSNRDRYIPLTSKEQALLSAENVGRWISPFIKAQQKQIEFDGLYRVIFPAGLPHTLMQYKTGGFGTPIVGEKGGIVGHASLQSVQPQIMLEMTFALMAAATQQYYLASIDSKLSIISRNTNQILDFLYGEKASDLASEISFVRYVADNFTELALSAETRTATLASLQESYKTAVKNIDFYLREIQVRAHRFGAKSSEDVKNIHEFLEMCRNLEMSRQLLVLSRILESALIGNFSKSYEKYILDEVILLSNRCNNQLNSCFGSIHNQAASLAKAAANNPFGNDLLGGLLGQPAKPGTELKKALDQLNKLEEEYRSDSDSFDRQCLENFLKQFHQEAKILVDTQGNCYLEK